MKEGPENFVRLMIQFAQFVFPVMTKAKQNHIWLQAK